MIAKSRWVPIAVSIVSLGIALVISIVALTGRNNMQIILLQPYYASLDKSGLLVRALVFVLASTAGIILLSRTTIKLELPGTLRIFAVITAAGLIAGLGVFYGFSCCDTPVVFWMGFPFSWLRGITPAQHYLLLPVFQYLLTHLPQIHWNVDAFSLIASALFWYDVALLVIVSRQIGWPFLLKRKNQQSIPKTPEDV